MEHVTVKDLVLGSGGVLVSGSEEAPVSHIRLIQAGGAGRPFCAPLGRAGWTATASFPR